MVNVKTTISFNYALIKELYDLFPNISAQFLAFLGKQARVTLKEELLSGQEINLNKYPRDKKGKYTIASDVSKNKKQVKIYSYPVNLFETGRKLRNDKQEQGHFIITKKLKSMVTSRMANYTSDFSNQYLPGIILKNIKEVAVK